MRGQAQAREADPVEVERLVVGVWAIAGQDPTAKRERGYREDWRLAKEWLGKGWGVDVVLEAARLVFAGPKRVGNPWSYLDKALPARMAELAEEAKASPAVVADSQRAARVRAFATNGVWLAAWGDEPAAAEVAGVMGGGQ